MDLSDALAIYDRVALNLDKLDRVWRQMEGLLPSRGFIGVGNPDEVTYDQLGEAWKEIADNLPAIDGWRLDAEVLGYAAIGRARYNYMDDDRDDLMAFDIRVAAPGMEALRYRQKLARARQRLVRQRGAELVKIVDDVLASVAADLDLEAMVTELDEKVSEAEVKPAIEAIRAAVDEIERLVGDALTGGPRHGDLHRHLHFGQPHDLRDIAGFDWPAFRPHVELALYGDEAPVPIDVDDLATLATATVTPVPSQIQ